MDVWWCYRNLGKRTINLLVIGRFSRDHDVRTLSLLDIADGRLIASLQLGVGLADSVLPPPISGSGSFKQVHTKGLWKWGGLDSSVIGEVLSFSSFSTL